MLFFICFYPNNKTKKVERCANVEPKNQLKNDIKVQIEEERNLIKLRESSSLGVAGWRLSHLAAKQRFHTEATNRESANAGGVLLDENDKGNFERFLFVCVMCVAFIFQKKMTKKFQSKKCSTENINDYQLDVKKKVMNLN